MAAQSYHRRGLCEARSCTSQESCQAERSKSDRPTRARGDNAQTCKRRHDHLCGTITSTFGSSPRPERTDAPPRRVSLTKLEEIHCASHEPRNDAIQIIRATSHRPTRSFAITPDHLYGKQTSHHGRLREPTQDGHHSSANNTHRRLYDCTPSPDGGRTEADQPRRPVHRRSCWPSLRGRRTEG